ncbi:Mur ligase family protein [Peredibacter sp. HCB2-198]|uniref:Mur ligase family protein n=1 Tax=Peredibacter sp. HCB2-198 TaxID=3383025 RepID=UPI0038B4D75D
MLNEKKLSEILGAVVPALSIKDIHWKTQDSTKESVLFYRLPDDEKSQKLFRERIQNSQFGWLIVNRDHESRPLNSTIIPESEWPRIQKEILDILYPMPNLKLMALTGTNGKTTTTDLVLQLGELCGKKGMSIGTLGVRENHKEILDFGLTSPPFIDLRKYLNQYGQDKDFCVLEASSHALMQERLYGLQFDMAGWLSFSQDHLDYHQTMESYFAAKALLFNYLKASARVYVPDNQEHLYEKIKGVTNKVLKAPVREEKLPLFFSTSFNRNNLEVAIAIVERTFNIKVPKKFDQIIPPDGRFYIKPYKSNYIVVDFAHTPDALENICRGIRESFPTHRLKVLFGCGGDRDRTKRPLMGKIAEAFGSHVYVTSDNPRTEDPKQIIQDILQGMSSKNITQIVERPKAVEIAFSELTENEILLLAGKGHEDYILINGVKHPYSDIAEVEKFLSRKSL